MAESLLDPDCRDGKCGSCVGGPCEHDCHTPRWMLEDAGIGPTEAQEAQLRARLEGLEQRAVPTKTRPGDQQLPAGGRECVQDALIALIEERKALGIQRYGSPLMTHNGRDSVRDATEEALDLTVYLMQVAMEMRDLRAERDALKVAVEQTAADALAHRLCAMRESGVLRRAERAEAAAKLAVAALEGAETTCRYHGEKRPEAPAWHGGCESCQQPTRVREALAAIRALTTEETDHV